MSLKSSSKIFVNLPVRDLAKSIEFFRGLGYRFSPQFTDESATCMVISDTIYAMLLVEPRFKSFIPGKKIADSKTSSEVLLSFSHESREEVRRICEAAFAAGARRYKEADDHGFMFAWGFEDLDGHIWEHFWMDPAHVQPTE